MRERQRVNVPGEEAEKIIFSQNKRGEKSEKPRLIQRGFLLDELYVFLGIHLGSAIPNAIISTANILHKDIFYIDDSVLMN